VLEGYLHKWANIFSRYHKYLFWVEDEHLKYISENKKKSNNGARCINLRNAYLDVDPKSKRKFRVVTARDRIQLKADSLAERDKWVATLR
jgi:hypothetical protein